MGMTSAVALCLNSFGLLAVSAVLLFAFADQLIYGDLPCPLCILQRAGLIAAGFGLALNLRFGLRASHYAVVILGAVIAAAVAVRQILLHIVPGTGAYGNPFLGLHFYTWAFIVSALIVIGSAAMLLFDRQFGDGPHSERLTGLTLVSFSLFALLTFGNAVSTLLECGSGLCPDNPTSYLLLP
jgi:disulfide bond formation protein DsbB